MNWVRFFWVGTIAGLTLVLLGVASIGVGEYVASKDCEGAAQNPTPETMTPMTSPCGLSGLGWGLGGMFLGLVGIGVALLSAIAWLGARAPRPDEKSVGD